MTGIRDRTVEITRVVPGNDGLVTQIETIEDDSPDGTESSTQVIKTFPANYCGCYRPYSFSCICGNRFCRGCFEAGRVWFCQECGRAIGSCCFEKRYDDRVFCPDHWRIDWKHPALQALAGVLVLGLFVVFGIFLHLVVH